MKYSINVDLGHLLNGADSVLTAAILPTINQAVQAVASETAYRWKDGVAKAKLWSGEKQPYMESIRWTMTGDFSAEVSTDYRLATEIENGRPARDMKAALSTSMKVRTATKGKHAGMRYLVVPFRHNVPGNSALAPAMPRGIYQMAKQLEASNVTGTGTRVSGTGAMGIKSKSAITVPQQTYKWGGRLPAGMAAKLKDHHATDIYANMVRFDTSAGGAKSSQFLTFRVMGEWSNGWIVPAKPGLLLAKTVRDQIAIEAPQVFEQAVKYLK